MQNNIKIPEISVVVLCYKTKDFASEFAQKIISMLEKRNLDYELILVGNYRRGSNDRTPDVVRSVAKEHPRVIAITKPKEGMMGWDMRTGLEAARENISALSMAMVKCPIRISCGFMRS